MAKHKPKRKPVTGYKRVFITRRKAMERLQLSLKDFRRLCILKGIYPVEPRKLKKGMTRGKTYYLLEDVRYLSHEPIIWKFWQYKSFLKKVTRASARKDETALKTLKDNAPTYKMDHIVKERYPTFIDALKDLDDALCMTFLYANFSKLKGIPVEVVELSRRLTLEFMHYVIETKSLRKVFVSIKGYYYQAEIMGQTITWITPHQFVLRAQPDVDMRVMRSFTEFYITLLGFVNYKLYSSINLYYPPRLNFRNENDKSMLSGDDNKHILYEYIASLNKSLPRNKIDEMQPENNPDEFVEEEGDEEAEVKKEKNMTFHQLMKLQSLFKGLKFFLSREVPRESLTFVIRCFEGEVSWDKLSFVGATFDENDPTITHQIVDREVIPNKFMNRYYIQPQWVYDSINARFLLPVEDYFHDAVLPPHLSPFVETTDGGYVPPEVSYQQNLAFGERKVDKEDSGNEEGESEDESADEEKDKKAAEQDLEHHSKKLKVQVRVGKEEKEDKKRKADLEKAEEKRLAIMMIPKKKKRLYKQIMYGKRKNIRESEKLREKREKYDAKHGNKQNKKAMKRKHQN